MSNFWKSIYPQITQIKADEIKIFFLLICENQ